MRYVTSEDILLTLINPNFGLKYSSIMGRRRYVGFPMFSSHYSPTDCLKAIMKRLEKGTKNTQLCTLTLLDSCVMNCGSSFHKAVATPDFVKEARAFLAKAGLLSTFEQSL